MNRDHKPAPEHEEEATDGGSHAADEPTAVWDESALRAAGLGDLLHRRLSDPPSAPAAGAGGASSAGSPSIVVDESMAASPLEADAEAPSAPPSRRGGRELGWGPTLAIAVALGALVYLAIRFFRG